MASTAPVQLGPGQSIFFNSGYKWTLGTSGLGGGKSFVGVLRGINYYYEHPGSLNLIAAPTYPQLRDSVYRTFLAIVPDGYILDYNENKGLMTVKARGGKTSQILWRSLLKYEFLRGVEFASAYVDEIALTSRQAWRVLKGRVRQPGYPNQGWATTTPRGRNWVYDEWVELPSSRHAWVHWPGTENNHLPEDYYDSLGYTGEFYRQEVLGEFGAFEGLVYDNFNSNPADLASTHLRFPRRNQVWKEVFGGLDFGGRNPSAACVFGEWGDGHVWQLDEFYKPHANLINDTVPAVLALTKKYGVTTWYADPSGLPYIDALRVAMNEANLDCVIRQADNDVVAGIQTVYALLETQADLRRGLYIHPKCVFTVKEYTSYQYDTKERANRDPDEKPMKQNDHALDATRYALHARYGRNRHGGGLAVAASSYSPNRSELERLIAEQLDDKLLTEIKRQLAQEEDAVLAQKQKNAEWLRQLQRWGMKL